jgi:hypothetical protein
VFTPKEEQARPALGIEDGEEDPHDYDEYDEDEEEYDDRFALVPKRSPRGKRQDPGASPKSSALVPRLPRESEVVAALQGSWVNILDKKETIKVSSLSYQQRTDTGGEAKHAKTIKLRWNPEFHQVEWVSGKYYLQLQDGAMVPMQVAVWMPSEGTGRGFSWRRAGGTAGDMQFALPSSPAGSGSAKSGGPGSPKASPFSSPAGTGANFFAPGSSPSSSIGSGSRSRLKDPMKDLKSLEKADKIFQRHCKQLSKAVEQEMNEKAQQVERQWREGMVSRPATLRYRR